MDQTSYEIVACNEIWNCDTDTFSHRAVLLRRNGQVFSARDPGRQGPVDQSKLSPEPIPVTHFRAPFTEDLTRAPDMPVHSEHVYIKEPQLIDYGMSTLAERETFYEPQLQEVRAYEILRLNPHPKIGIYHGCIVEDYRIRGLSLRRYHRTFNDALKDENFGYDQRRSCLEDVKQAVAHLHSLGLIHGDLNPFNVMLDGSRAVLVDFDSCQPAGERMGRKGGTWEWCPDLFPDTAEPEQDQAALKLLGVSAGCL